MLFLALKFIFGPIIINAQFPNDPNEADCNSSITDSEFWTWTRQQTVLIDEQDDGTMNEFLTTLEQDEQLLFPPPVIHPIAQKYIHGINESYDSNSSGENEMKNAQNNGERAKSLTRRLSDNLKKSFNKITYFCENSAENLQPCIEVKEEEKFGNSIQLLRNYSINLKRYQLLGGQCIHKIMDLSLEFKHHVDLIIDLVAVQFGLNEIVPLKINFDDGKILKKLAIKWMKVKRKINNKNKSKGSKEWEEKGQKYLEELLELIKGLVNSERFGHQNAGTSSSKVRRRRRRMVIPWYFIAGMVLAVVVTLLLVALILPPILRFLDKRIVVRTPPVMKRAGVSVWTAGNNSANQSPAEGNSKKANGSESIGNNDGGTPKK